MKDHPIIFSAPMIRAILSGQKTQTRRLVKPAPPPEFLRGDVAAVTNGMLWAISKMPERKAWPADPAPGFACPFGQPSDGLWVRETWQADEIWDDYPPRNIPQGTPILWTADYDCTGVVAFDWGKLRPSMFMPRWASRITLEITGVRLERLQDISEVDALAEGCLGSTTNLDSEFDYVKTAKDAFCDLWESINGTGSWEANPWVWTISFKRILPLPGIDAAQSAI